MHGVENNILFLTDLPESDRMFVVYEGMPS